MTKFAVIFPGQGSQVVGMCTELAKKFPVVKYLFSQASEVLGYDLWQLVQAGPIEKLNRTAYTQPALLTASVAIWECWKEQGGAEPTLMAGHSLGEYSALTCAQALTFSDAVRIVALRGRYMQEAVVEGEGAMAAIVGLDNDAVVRLCEVAMQPGEVLSPANFNSLGQVVIAGHTKSVNAAVIQAEKKGARLAKLIPISVPSHCVLMQPVVDRLAKKLEGIIFQEPKIPVIQNADVQIHKRPENIRHALIVQLVNPVRWVDTIQKILDMGVVCMLECGPGAVLAGLNKRIDKSIQTYPIHEPEQIDKAMKKIQGAEICL